MLLIMRPHNTHEHLLINVFPRPLIHLMSQHVHQTLHVLITQTLNLIVLEVRHVEHVVTVFDLTVPGRVGAEKGREEGVAEFVVDQRYDFGVDGVG